MKKSIFMVALLCLLNSTLFSQAPQNTLVLLFPDQTMSTPVALVKEQYELKLMKFLEESIREPNDEVVLAFVYEMTESYSNRLKFKLIVPETDLTGLNERETNRALAQRQEDFILFKSLFIKKVVKAAFSVPSDGKITDIVGTLPIIKQYRNKGFHKVKALYVSDLIETKYRSLKYNSRNPVHNPSTARIAAKEDYEKIKASYDLPYSFLKDIEISVILPHYKNQLQRKPELVYTPVFWNELWSLFGAKVPNYL